MTEVRLDEIYEGLFDDGAFARLPGLLADAASARSAIIQWRRPGTQFEAAGHSGLAPGVLAAYAHRWKHHDPWAVAAMHPRRLNRLHLSEDGVSQAEFGATPFYNEFLRPDADDLFHCMGAGFSTPWGEGLFGLLRRRTEPAFETADVERFRPYAKAANRVLKTKSELAAARGAESAAKTSLDTLALAVIAVDRRGRVISINDAAETVLRRGDGLVARAGLIDARSRGDSNSLRHALSLAAAQTRPAARTVRITRGADRSDYLVTVSPVVGPSAGRRRAVLVFSDPDASDASLADRLRTLFSLSPAEASVAVELARGKSAAEIALERGVQQNTLKAQLASIMAKMGCRRQAEVAAIIAALPLVRA